MLVSRLIPWKTVIENPFLSFKKRIKPTRTLKQLKTRMKETSTKNYLTKTKLLQRNMKNVKDFKKKSTRNLTGMS